MASGASPPAYTIPGLSLSGARPFYQSFEASATATLAQLRPKSLGGVPLPGREIALAVANLVGDINRDAPASLHAAVYSSLRGQADDAINAGVHEGIESLRSSLLPAPVDDDEDEEG